uniref:Mediator of RNA polymerase II transcription subunit 27 n=1 Tax=Panagrellus redivivus TaxID=6233 RepID=A0A7E4ZZ42_PANRE
MAAFQNSAKKAAPLDLASIQESVANCVHSVRHIAHLENWTSNFGHTTDDSIKSIMAYRNLDDKSRELSRVYDQLHRTLNTMPDALYSAEKPDPTMDAIMKFIDEASTDFSVMNTFDATQDALRQQSQTLAYAETCHASLIPHIGNTKHRSIYVDEPEVPKCDGSSDIKEKQKEFETNLKNGIMKFNARFGAKNGKITEKSHDKSVVHAIHELSVQYARESFKLILLVTRGKIDYVNIYGANEDVKYLDDRRKKVDPYAPSQFHAFNSQIQLVNNHFHVFETNQKPKADMETTLFFLVQVAQKVLAGFTSSCVTCKKVLKNGLLPVVSDMKKGSYIHEECK